MSDVDRLYRERFDEAERGQKNKVWMVLCKSFFQKYVGLDHTVLDLGAGYCEFINNIRCKTKYAVDLNDNLPVYAGPDVTPLQAGGSDLAGIEDGSVDAVFASNFFEHLGSKEDVLKTLREIRRVLKDTGKLMILQPNIKYLVRDFWDFFDHRLPLSHKSMVEALAIAGLRAVEVKPKFLPFTTKSRFPKSAFLVRAYLKLPFLYSLLGRQMFIVAVKEP